MADSTVREVCAQLRDISDRLARFEPVPQAEIDAFLARKAEVFEEVRP